jgi:hypothetical protein
MLLDTETFVISPGETPGFVHADRLTEESARATEDCLRENNEKHHIFFTLEDHMGVGEVRETAIVRADGFRSTCTTTSHTTTSRYGRWVPSQRSCASSTDATRCTCATR